MLVKKKEIILPSDKVLEKERKKFIDGAVSNKNKEMGAYFMNLKMPMEFKIKIDNILKTKRIGMNRTAWILEAIQEKLRKD